MHDLLWTSAKCKGDAHRRDAASRYLIVTMGNDAEITAFWRMFTARMRDRRMTQVSVAAALGITRQAVNAWGRDSLPSPENIAGLAPILDWPAEEILAAVNASGDAGSVAKSASNGGHIVRQDLAQRFNVDEKALLQRAVHGLDALRDLLGTKEQRHLSRSQGGLATMKSAQSGPGGDIWDGLTPEQRYGLALLIEGKRVDPGHLRAAMHLMGLLGEPSAQREPAATDGSVSTTRSLRPSGRASRRPKPASGRR